MGDPNTGEIYRGALRAGDVGLDEESAKLLKEMIPERRIEDLMARFRSQGAQAAADSGVSRPMPRYKCHKEVWALKIAAVEPITAKPTIAELEAMLDPQSERPPDPIIGGYRIVPSDEGFAPFEVSFEYIGKHKPEAGGYYVVYADGYKSYSPAKAFEDGYTRI